LNELLIEHLVFLLFSWEMLNKHGKEVKSFTTKKTINAYFFDNAQINA
jgi:hypothetical protein